MKLLCALLLLPLLAFGAGPGDLIEGKWVQINVPTGIGSTLDSVKHSPNPGGNVNNIIGSWSGGAFATTMGTRGSLLIHGGGHGDYVGNELYRFDVATGLWSKLYGPGSSCNLATSTMNSPANAPCASHTYDSLEFATTTGEFIKMGSSSDDGSVLGTGAIKAYSVAQNTWRTAGQLGGVDTDPSDDMESATTAWDSVNQVVWWNGSSRSPSPRLRKFNPVTGVVSTYTGVTNNGIDAVSAYSPDAQAFVMLDGRDPDENEIYAISTSGGTPVVYDVPYTGISDIPGQVGFDYDPVVQKFLIYQGGTGYATLTAPTNWTTTRSGTWVWANVSAGSGTADPGAQQETGTWGRLRYVPALCGFIVVNSTTGGVYALRLPGGAGAGCGGSPPADPPPAVSLTANPTSINPGGNSTLTWNSSNASNCTFQYAALPPASVPTSGFTNFTLSVTTTFTFACNGLLSQSATVATAPPVTVIVNSGTGNTGDFATRCAAAGVKRCTSFDTDADFAPYPGVLNAAGDGVFRGVRDTAVKSSGASSLRFDVTQADAGANTSGFWLDYLWDEALVGGTASSHFGPGETFYFQFRLRMDSSMVNMSSSGEGNKLFILHPRNLSSCTTLQFVTINGYHRGYPSKYASCGSAQVEVNLPDGDIRIQQGDVDCRYRDQSGCKPFTADNWMTFKYKFTLAAFGSPSTRIEGWMSNDGQAPVKIFDKPDFVLDYDSSPSEKLSAIQITNYDTGRTSGGSGKSWYDDLIVSTQDIAWPSGGSAPPVPTVTLTANPLTVNSGSFSTLDWTSTNATDCQASGAWSGPRATSGAQDTDPLTAGATFTLICSGSGGTSAPATVNVGVNSAPPVINITATPTSVPKDSGTLIGWSVTNATSCLASGGWFGIKNPVSGSQFSNALPATTTFTLTCSGAGGSSSNAVTVTVTTPQPVIDTFTVNFNPIDYGTTPAFTWTSTDATSCDFTSPASVPAVVDGTASPFSSITVAVTVTLRCQNALGSTSRSILLGVNPIPNATVALTPVNPTITLGGSQLLTWTTTNANACTGTPAGAWAVAVAAAPGGGSLSVSPTVTTAYDITCTAAAGSPATATTQVIVNSAVADPVVNLYANPTQITSGTASTLYWTVENATSCAASVNWSGAKAFTSGTVHSESTGNLASGKGYILTCTNAGGGTGADGADVTVTAPPVPPATSIVARAAGGTAGPTATISLGDAVFVQWSCTNSTTATPSAGGADPDWLSATALGGFRILYPAVNTTYTMTCSDGVTPDADSVTVTVNAARTLSLTASPAIAFTNGSTTLTWVTGGPLDTCFFQQGLPFSILPGDSSISTGNLTAPTTFQLACGVGAELAFPTSGPYCDSPLIRCASITVNVTPNTPPNSRHRRRWWRFRR